MNRIPPDSDQGNRNRRRRFRPRFTIGILYLAGFFFFFAFLQILPDLIQLLELPPGPDQEAAAKELARRKSNPLLSLILSVAATSAGAYYEFLPGLSERG